MAMPSFNSPHSLEKRRLGAQEAVEQQQSIPVPYEQMDVALLPEGCLRNANGTIVSQQALSGLSVGFYFADNEDPRCCAFLPFLLQFYRTVNEGGCRQKLEIIFVSLDRDVESFRKHRVHMPWLYVEFEHEAREMLKQHFRIGNSYDHPHYGQPRVSPTPALVVAGEDGRTLEVLHIASGREEGERALRRWDHRLSLFTRPGNEVFDPAS